MIVCDPAGPAERRHRLTLILALIVPVAATLRLHAEDTPLHDQRVRPAEETRLDPDVFHEAFRRRGLTELLELHLKDFPPPGRVAKRLMERDMALTVFADRSRPTKERIAAIARANEILATLIDQGGDDLGRFEWRFTLAHSLLYDEAEPHFTSILYRGGGETIRRRLRALTTRAIATLEALSDDLAKEYARVDKLSVPAFERLQGNGHIERIDRLGPKAGYLLAWARFYDSLARDNHDSTRARRLHAIVEYLAGNQLILDTPHTTSRVQVPALLLAGMTKRRLNDYVAARGHFNRALRIADHLAEPVLIEGVAWTLPLARIERIRNDRDDGRFDHALRAVDSFRRFIIGEHNDGFGLQIVAALLERSIHRARANAAERAGNSSELKRAREQAWRTLARLAARNPARRDEIYATLYELIGPTADPAGLDPFEQCALLAGLLFDTARADEMANPLLDRAVSAGEYFLAHEAENAGALTPEVLYNVAVAQYRQGRIADAAKRFVEVARDHPSFGNALQAATNAVQLSAELYADPALRSHPQLQELYLGALEIVVTRFPDTDASRYWRFYYAQFLDEFGNCDQAAGQYAKVHALHEHYLESKFLRVRCLALLVKAAADETPDDVLDLRLLVDEFLEAQRGFVAHVSGELVRDSESTRATMLRDWTARATLMGAEILILPQIDRPALALETLNEFDAETSPQQSTLAGRVWRVRLVAYEKLGRLDEATRAILAFVTADPAGAGPALQSLYVSVAQQAKHRSAQGNKLAARRKAEVALVLAEQIVAWADKYATASTPVDRPALAAQLAEAYLEVGQYRRARELFEPLAVTDQGSPLPTDPTTLRALLGYAESLFQLGDWSAALPRFNKLAIALPPADPIRWKSLLRDLQCRTALQHPPRDLINVIEQQRFLCPDLGGPALAPEFEKLQRENQRRSDAD